MTRVSNFADLLQAARRAGPKTVAIAAAHEHEVLQAAAAAASERIAECILVGDESSIRENELPEGVAIALTGSSKEVPIHIRHERFLSPAKRCLRPACLGFPRWGPETGGPRTSSTSTTGSGTSP